MLWTLPNIQWFLFLYFYNIADPGTLGYPLFINGSQCMPNFVLQKQFVKLESSTVVVVDYCVAPHGFIYQRHNNAKYNKFKQFCLFLVGKTMYCPAGKRITCTHMFI